MNLRQLRSGYLRTKWVLQFPVWNTLLCERVNSNGCEAIASGSPHGLVDIRIYGIPSAWIEILQRIAGNGFKFRDYLASLGIADIEPLQLLLETSTQTLPDACHLCPNALEPDRLLDDCPSA